MQGLLGVWTQDCWPIAPSTFHWPKHHKAGSGKKRNETDPLSFDGKSCKVVLESAQIQGGVKNGGDYFCHQLR